MRLNKSIIVTVAAAMTLTMPTAAFAQEKVESNDSTRPSASSPVKPDDSNIKNPNMTPPPSKPDQKPAQSANSETEAIKNLLQQVNKEHREELKKLREAYRFEMQKIKESIKQQTMTEEQAFNDARKQMTEALKNNEKPAVSRKQVQELRKQLNQTRKAARAQMRTEIAELNKAMKEQTQRLNEEHRARVQSIMDNAKPASPQLEPKPYPGEKPSLEAPNGSVGAEKKSFNR
jgi:HAMP domain-containing protein